MPWSHWRSSLADVFGVDLRSLALLRISVGLLCAVDALDRSWFAAQHYADSGVHPILSAMSALHGASFSLHFAHGSALFQWLLLMLTGLTALVRTDSRASLLNTSIQLFAAGWHSSRVAVALWVLVVSTHNRNLLVCDVGDAYLAAVLFWCMFLPLGARFSIDAALRRRRLVDAADWHVSAASAALVLQISLFTFVSASRRSGREWSDGSAIYYALSLDSHATAIGLFVLRWPFATRVLTRLFVLLEWGVTLAAVAPVLSAPLRIVAVACSFALHLGFGVLLELGMWVWVPPFVALALLPSVCWQWWRRLLHARTSTIRVTHQRGRRRVRAALLAARELLLLGESLRVDPTDDADSTTAVQVVPLHAHDDGDDGDRRRSALRGVDAVIAIAQASPLCEPLWTVPFGESIVRWLLCTRVVHWLVAHWLPDDDEDGEDDCGAESVAGVRVPPRLFLSSLEATWRDALRLVRHWLSGRSLLRESFVLCMLLATLLCAAPEDARAWPAARTALSWVQFARLEPRFLVLAPSVSRDDGWFTLNGQRVDGLKVSVWTDELDRGRGVAWLAASVLAWLNGGTLECCAGVPNARTAHARPRIISQQFGGVMRWRNAWRQYRLREHERTRLPLAQFLCRHWNQQQPDPVKMLATFELMWMSEITLPSYHVRVVEPVPLWAHECVAVSEVRAQK